MESPYCPFGHPFMVCYWGLEWHSDSGRKKGRLGRQPSLFQSFRQAVLDAGLINIPMGIPSPGSKV